MRLILAAGDRANQFVEQQRPVEPGARTRPRPSELQRRLHDRPEPVPPVGRLPGPGAAAAGPADGRAAERSDHALGRNRKQPLVGTPVGRFKHMMQRVDREQVDAMIAASTEPEPPEAGRRRRRAARQRRAAAGRAAGGRRSRSTTSPRSICASPACVAAEDVPEAKKLLKLTLSLGGDEPPHGLRRHQGAPTSRSSSSAGC